MNIAVEKVPFEHGLSFARNLGFNLPTVQILNEKPFETDGTALQSARKNHQNNGCKCQRNNDGVGKACQIVADIEQESRSNSYAHEDSKYKRQAVHTAFNPQGSEFVAMVILHDKCTHKGCNKHQCEHTACAIGPPVGQKMSDKRQEKGEHDSRYGRNEDGIYKRVERHLFEQALPQAFFGSRSLMFCTHVVEPA